VYVVVFVVGDSPLPFVAAIKTFQACYSLPHLLQSHNLNRRSLWQK
jgi:hypothetical protein